MADDKRGGGRTVREDVNEAIEDPPVETSRQPSARAVNVRTLTKGEGTDYADDGIEAHEADIEVSGFTDMDGKAVTLVFRNVPAPGGKVPDYTMTGLLESVGRAWQRPEDRADWIRQFGKRQ